MAPFDTTKEAQAVESVEEEEVTWDSGTAEDQYDMTRMGKKQELRVGPTVWRFTRTLIIQLNETRGTSSSYQF